MRVLCLLVLLLASSSCTGREVTPASQAQTLEWFRTRGGGFIESPAVQQYFSGLLNRLTAALGPDCQTASQRWNWFLGVVDNPKANAFSFGHGYVVITSALVLQTESEDQLASIIAHEMAHHCLRHPHTLPKRSQGQSPAVIFTAEQELEADRLGVEILHRANFDTVHALQALVIPYRENGGAVSTDDQQALEQRLRQLEELGQKYHRPFPQVRNRRYRAMKIALVSAL